MGPMGPPPSDKFESIAKALDLSKDQRKAVRSILDDGAKEAVPLRDQLSKSRIAVGEAIGANKDSISAARISDGRDASACLV